MASPSTAENRVTPRRKTSVLTLWPTPEGQSAVYNSGQMQQSTSIQFQTQKPLQQHTYLPPVDYDDDDDEAQFPPSSTGNRNLQFNADDMQLTQEQQQQMTSMEDKQMRRKISMSNITGKVKMPSRRRSVIEMGTEFFTDPSLQQQQQPTSPGMAPLMEAPQQQRANSGRKQPVINAPTMGAQPLPVRDY